MSFPSDPYARRQIAPGTPFPPAPLTELASLLQGQLQHTLGAGGEGDLHGHKAAPPADDLLDLHTRIFQRDAHRLEDLGGDAWGKEEVLR